MAFASKEKSRIKMVVLTISGVDNITWYSPERANSKPDDVVINGMLSRFKTRPEMKYANKIQFYNNTPGGAMIREFQVL